MESIIEIDSPQINDPFTPGMPFAEDLEIIIHLPALEAMQEHGAGDLKNEVGGIMLGEVYKNEERTFVEITHSIPALAVNSGAAHVEFTNKTWEGMEQTRAARYPDRKVVGWYHTHPGLGLFFSTDDIFIHTHAFPQPWHVALVLDPVNEAEKFFRWKGNEILACPSYTIKVQKSNYKKSLFKQVSHEVKILERGLDFERHYDHLKEALAHLKNELVQQSQEERNFFVRPDFLKVMTAIAGLDPLAIQEAKTLLMQNDQIKLTALTTHKVMDQLPPEAHNIAVVNGHLYYLDDVKRLYMAALYDGNSSQRLAKRIRRIGFDANGKIILFDTKNRISSLNAAAEEQEFPKQKAPLFHIALDKKDGFEKKQLRAFVVIDKRVYVLTSQKLWIFAKPSVEGMELSLLNTYPNAADGLTAEFQDMVVDARNTCYLAGSAPGRVIKINAEGELAEELDSHNALKPLHPSSLCFTAGVLYALDAEDGRIVRFNPDTKKYEKQYISTLALLNIKIREICASPAGEIYFFADRALYKIIKQER